MILLNMCALAMVASAGVASAGALFVEDFNDNSLGCHLQQMDTDGIGLVVENESVHITSNQSAGGIGSGY